MSNDTINLALLTGIACMASNVDGFSISKEDLKLDKDEYGFNMDDVSHVVLCKDRIYLVKKDSSDEFTLPDFTKDSVELTKDTLGTWDDYGFAIITKDGTALYPKDSEAFPYPKPTADAQSWAWADISHVLIGPTGIKVVDSSEKEKYPYPVSPNSDDTDGSASTIKTEEEKKKEDAEIIPSPAKTDAERAMEHFKISQEDWDKLTDEEKTSKIAELPDPKGGEGEGEPKPINTKKSDEAPPDWQDLPDSTKAFFETLEAPPDWQDLPDDVKEIFGEKDIFDTWSKDYDFSVKNGVPPTPVPSTPGPDVTLNASDEKLVVQLAKEKVEGIHALIAKIETLASGEDPEALRTTIWALEDLMWKWRGDLDVISALTLAEGMKEAMDKAQATLDSINGVRSTSNDSAHPKMMFRDAIVSETGFVEDADGNLVCKDATLFMPMIQTYNIDSKDVRVLKHPDELALAVKYADGYVTDDHPSLGYVDSPCLIKGRASDSRINDKNGIDQTITIEDKDLKAKVKDGKTDLSGGFQAWLDFTPGTWNDEDYDALQRGILVDHTAVVDNGRCNSSDGCGMRIFDSVDKSLSADAKKEISVLNDKVRDLEVELKTPVVDSILGISVKKSREDLMAMDRKDLIDLLDMVRDGKPADDDLKSRKNIDSRTEVNDAYTPKK